MVGRRSARFQVVEFRVRVVHDLVQTASSLGNGVKLGEGLSQTPFEYRQQGVESNERGRCSVAICATAVTAVVPVTAVAVAMAVAAVALATVVVVVAITIQ